MFTDFWHEIYESVKRKPTRAVLTGIGITWGIFILVLLVSMGAAFERGVFKLFSGFSKSTTYIYASETSVGYKGASAGKKITFTETDLHLLKRAIPQINAISPEVSRWNAVSAAGKRGWFETKGVYPEYFSIKLVEPEQGRILDPLDMRENRNVALIGRNVAEVLFDRQNPIGKRIRIGQELYRVVGVIKNTLLNTSEARAVYLPYRVWLHSNREAREFNTLLFSLAGKTDNRAIQTRIKSVMARQHYFSPADDKVFYFNSMEEQVKAFTDLFVMLQKFLWFMGISTLVGGVIGVANIMYASARERTKEIGIRKAVGAKTGQIKAMIIAESVALTAGAGYIGVGLAWGVLQIAGAWIPPDTPLLDTPAIHFPTAVAALVILILAGTLAGLKPALFAAELNPIDALRDEN